MAVTFINPSVDPLIINCLLFTLVCVPRVVQKSASTNFLRGYMIKPTSRKTMVSNAKNIEISDRHARHRSGTSKCICTLLSNLPLEGKAAVLILPRFQGSL